MNGVLGNHDIETLAQIKKDIDNGDLLNPTLVYERCVKAFKIETQRMKKEMEGYASRSILNQIFRIGMLACLMVAASSWAGVFVYRTPYNYDMVQGMGYTAGGAFMDARGSIPWGYVQSGGEYFRCQYSLLNGDICTGGDFVIATFPVSRNLRKQ